MGGKIDAYVDVVSPYSWFAFKYLRKNRELLRSHGVEVEFHPFFLGGVNVATGNKPPWTLAAKASYGTFDRARASAYFDLPNHPAPSFFPVLTVLPNRALLSIKHHPSPSVSSRLEAALERLWQALWVPEYLDVSQPENLAAALKDVFEGVVLESGEGKEAIVKQILRQAQTQEAKDWLKANTETVVRTGGFGAPWCWVTNGEGKQEGFFGSDRFHYMWEYLGLPVRHLEIIPKIEGKTAKL